MIPLTESLASFVVNTRQDDIPAEALDKAKKAIADTFAVILAGANSEVTEPLLEYVRKYGPPGESPILGTRLSVSSDTAALINGTFGHALDFDDVLTMMPGHPSAVIVSALLADLGNRPLSGRAFLNAYQIGLEVGAKIGLGITIGHTHRGYHGTGTLGIFSATAALCRSLQLDVPATRTAFGIASSMASGLQCNFGTMTKPLHTGLAARSALLAARLADSGLTAMQAALEGKNGFFEAYGVEQSDCDVTARNLGKPWFIVDPGLSLKKFACTYAAHRGIDAVLEFRRRHPFEAKNVTLLECRVPPGGLRSMVYASPKNGLESKFSMQYALAAGLLDGQYTLSTFTDQAVNRPEIQETMKRINVFEDARCANDDPLLHTLSPGSRGFVEATIHFDNGTVDTVRIDKPTGHPTRELDWDAIGEKFHDCAQACVSPERAREAYQLLEKFEDIADVNELVNLLH